MILKYLSINEKGIYGRFPIANIAENAKILLKTFSGRRQKGVLKARPRRDSCLFFGLYGCSFDKFEPFYISDGVDVYCITPLTDVRVQGSHYFRVGNTETFMKEMMVEGVAFCGLKTSLKKLNSLTSCVLSEGSSPFEVASVDNLENL